MKTVNILQSQIETANNFIKQAKQITKVSDTSVHIMTNIVKERSGFTYLEFDIVEGPGGTYISDEQRITIRISIDPVQVAWAINCLPDMIKNFIQLYTVNKK